jgi:uncharacterized protein (TIGR00369 family)
LILRLCTTSTLLDTAMYCAIHSMLPAGTAYTTMELHINFLRPLTIETGVVRCESESLHSGRTVATAQGRLLDAAGKLYAHGTRTSMIMRGSGEPVLAMLRPQRDAAYKRRLV